MAPPFKLHPVQAQPTKGTRVKEPGLSMIIGHAYEEGETVAEAATESQVPDRLVGDPSPIDVSGRMEDHPQRPMYTPENPYPPIEKTHRPFKI